MKTGLVLGKFYPLHKGHLGLINFAVEKCDKLFVWVCASTNEKISGDVRLNWVKESFQGNDKIFPILLNYSEDELPNSSLSSMLISKIWSQKIKEVLGEIDCVFSSEDYGEYLAQLLNCNHYSYEPNRTSNQISSTEIRKNALLNWKYLADAAKPFFVKKICIYGTESTGKSMLTERLAHYFHTNYVPEMAREIIEESESCTKTHLKAIASLHAKTLLAQTQRANKLLFVDTDINITRSYSRFLFQEELIVEDWIEAANQFDLYLFLDNDAPYIQDGSRLDEFRRNQLSISHKKELVKRQIEFISISGNWEERFNKSVKAIKILFHI